jgi:hypothetical protein
MFSCQALDAEGFGVIASSRRVLAGVTLSAT